MVISQKIQTARRLLLELKKVLNQCGDQNWIRGIDAALDAICEENGEDGCADARSIYKTMTEAKNGFSDFYIQRSDSKEQIEANKHLDELRDKLWETFKN